MLKPNTHICKMLKLTTYIATYGLNIITLSILVSFFLFFFLIFYDFSFDYSKAFLELSKLSNKEIEKLYLFILSIIFIVYSCFSIVVLMLTGKSKTTKRIIKSEMKERVEDIVQPKSESKSIPLIDKVHNFIDYTLMKNTTKK